MWAISSALKMHSLSNFEGQTLVDRQWDSLKDQECQDVLMGKFFCWLVALAVLGIVYRIANCPERTNRESLFSLLEFLKTSRWLSEMEPDYEIDKGLA